MLSASRRQPHLLHVSAVDRRQIWSMDKSWRCVTLSVFLHSHIVRCRWNPISCGTHYSGPGLSENDSAVTIDVGEDQNREVWSSSPTNQYPTFYRPNTLPVAQLTMSENWRKSKQKVTTNEKAVKWKEADLTTNIVDHQFNVWYVGAVHLKYVAPDCTGKIRVIT